MTDSSAPRPLRPATQRPSTPGPHSAPADGHGDPPLSVWPTAQHDARTQRRGRYLPAATAHPAKMLPAVAAITRYTKPGDLTGGMTGWLRPSRPRLHQLGELRRRFPALAGNLWRACEKWPLNRISKVCQYPAPQ